MPFDALPDTKITPRRLSYHDRRRLEVLKKAQLGIEQKWCKGTFQAGDLMCPVRWLEYLSSPARARTIIAKHLYPFIPDDFIGERPARSALIGYNDDPRTTQADIVNLFRRAAQRLEWGV